MRTFGSAVERAHFRTPAAACDCHMHVFGPLDRYPPASPRAYTPSMAPLSAWREVAGALGLRRVVVVQPSAYGPDNSCLLDAMAELGASARGVAQIDASTDAAVLGRLHAAGVRGVRLNPKSVGARDSEALGALVTETAQRVAPLGWHVQLYAELAMIRQLAQVIARAACPVVLDHMAGARVSDGPDALRPVLDLLGEGRCWVKLSAAYRVSAMDRGFEDATAIARSLIRANPERVVWGTDWPHAAPRLETSDAAPPSIEFRSVDEISLLDRLADACGDQGAFDRILETNPGRLYDF